MQGLDYCSVPVGLIHMLPPSQQLNVLVSKYGRAAGSSCATSRKAARHFFDSGSYMVAKEGSYMAGEVALADSAALERLEKAYTVPDAGGCGSNMSTPRRATSTRSSSLGSGEWRSFMEGEPVVGHSAW